MRKLLFILVAFITTYSCKNEPVCAGIFVHQVELKDSLGNAIVLDTFYTVCLDKPDTLNIKRYMKDSLQYYPLIDDTYYKVFTQHENTGFKFVGIKGSDTISSPYIFKYDGCHTILVSGTYKIVH